MRCISSRLVILIMRWIGFYSLRNVASRRRPVSSKGESPTIFLRLSPTDSKFGSHGPPMAFCSDEFGYVGWYSAGCLVANCNMNAAIHYIAVRIPGAAK